MRDTFLVPFEACAEANAMATMCSYNGGACICPAGLASPRLAQHWQGRSCLRLEQAWLPATACLCCT